MVSIPRGTTADDERYAGACGHDVQLAAPSPWLADWWQSHQLIRGLLSLGGTMSIPWPGDAAIGHTPVRSPQGYEMHDV